MSRTPLRKASYLALSLTVMASVAACSRSDKTSSDNGPIVIGSTLPLSGPLSVLGDLIRTGEQQAIDEVNADGGVTVNGVKRKVELVVLDNATDPNEVTRQATALVQDEGAVALVGSVTPPLSISLSSVGERLKVPTLVTNTPILSWQAGNPDGWNYAWDAYVDEAQQTQLDFEAAALADTNQKVALFTDTEDDGVTMGDLWETEAEAAGFTVVYRADFPVGTTNFAQYIEEAKAAGAESVFGIMIPPDAIALWKQMKALDYSPKVMTCQKCSHTSAWPDAVGPLAEGTMQFGWWAPDLGYADSEHIEDLWGDTIPLVDLQTVAINYGLTKILLDAIGRADTATPEDINRALADTNLDTSLGKVTFDDDNTFRMPAFMNQWQGSDVARVFPTGEGAADMIAPMPGFIDQG